MASEKAERRNASDCTGKPKLWTARVCPFAERVWFALSHLNVDHDYEEIDLANKSEKFLALPHVGKVPVIEDNGHVLYESQILLEYVDETWKAADGKRLYPENPVAKARAKIFTAMFDSSVVPLFYRMTYSTTDEGRGEAFQVLLGGLAKVDAQMRELSPTGPFVLGKDVSFADMVLIPHIRRVDIARSIFGLEVPNTPEYERLHRWKEACLALPSYKRITDDVTSDELLSRFKGYLQKKKEESAAK